MLYFLAAHKKEASGMESFTCTCGRTVALSLGEVFVGQACGKEAKMQRGFAAELFFDVPEP